jgi:hypothetical protein
MRTWTVNRVGFSSSDDEIDVFAETEQRHGQLGEMNPDHLVFSGLNYRKTSGSWYVMNPSIYGLIGPPYGAEFPSTSKVEVWTNAH